MNLNLKGFKKVKSDKETTTLEHPSGHQIVVKHSALPGKMRGQLEAIPTAKGAAMDDGGDVPAESEDDHYAKEQAYLKSPKYSEQYRTPGGLPSKPAAPAGPISHKQQLQNMEDVVNGVAKAKGGEVEAYDEGTPDAPVQEDTPNFSSLESGTPPPPDALHPGQQLGSILFGGQTTPNQAAAQAEAEKMMPQGADEGKVKPRTADIAAPAPTQMPKDAASSSPTPAPTPAGASLFDAAQTSLRGINEQIAGKQKEGEQLAAQSTALQPTLDSKAQALQTVQTDLQNHFQHLDKVNQDLNTAIANGQVDPNHFINNMSTGGRIMSALGLILGGAGGGATGQGNPALDFLNKQIDRDIDAQKTQIGNNKTLLEANLRQYGNYSTAADVTRMQIMTMAESQLNSEANKFNNPLITARTQQLTGELQRTKGDIQKQAAMTMMLSNAQKSGNPENTIAAMRYLNPEMAKEMESRYVPGVGMASVPISENARGQFVAMKNFDSQMRDLYAFAQKHSGETSLTSPSDVREGMAKAQAVQNAYRTGQDMGVYKASEAPLLEGEIPNDPTAFFNKFRVLPQYKAALDNNTRKLGVMGKLYGMNIPGTTQITPTAPAVKK